MSAEHNQSNGQIFKELPIPKEGIARQVLNEIEIVTDRDEFVKSELNIMKEQNPPLHDWLINVACMESPYRNLSLVWALAYYAIHSRSTHPEGMPKVSADVIIVKHDDNIQIIKNSIEKLQKTLDSGSVSEKVIALFLQNPIKIQRLDLISRDMERSRELEIFWERIISLEDSLAAYNSPQAIESVFESTYALSARLHAQVEVDRLKQQFPGI